MNNMNIDQAFIQGFIKQASLEKFSNQDLASLLHSHGINPALLLGGVGAAAGAGIGAATSKEHKLRNALLGAVGGGALGAGGGMMMNPSSSSNLTPRPISPSDESAIHENGPLKSIYGHARNAPNDLGDWALDAG